MTDMKMWYQSRAVWGGLVAILASCANLAGLDITADDQMQLVDGLTALAAAAGGLLAVYGRISAIKRVK